MNNKVIGECYVCGHSFPHRKLIKTAKGKLCVNCKEREKNKI